MKKHYTVTEINSRFEMLSQRFANNADQRIVGKERDNLINHSIDAYFKAALLGEQGQFKNDETSFGQVIDISSHLVTEKELDVYTPVKASAVDGFRYLPEKFAADSFDVLDYKVYALLPTEILYPLEGAAVVKQRKNDDGCDKAGTRKIIISNDKNLQEYIAVIPFVANVTEACSNSTMDFTITILDRPTGAGNADLVIFDYSKFTEDLGYDPISGLSQKGDFIYIANFILEYMNRHNALVEIISDTTSDDIDIRDFEGNFYKVYWERYREQYYPDSFIIVSRERVDVSINSDLTIAGGGTVNPFTSPNYITDVTYNNGLTTKGGLMVRIDSNFGVDVQTGNVGFTEGRFQQVSRSRSILPLADYSDSMNPANISPTPNPVPKPAITFALIPLEIARENKRFTTRRFNPLANTRRKVYSRLAESVIELYPVEGQVIDKIYLSYYRVPRYLNTEFNVNPDLPKHVMNSIIEHASRNFLEIIGSPRAASATQRVMAEKNIENQY